MASGGKGKERNVASFIKEHFNIVGNSLLVMALLGLEKLMDLEFKCPNDKPLAVGYSFVFLVVPTVIVGILACYLSPKGMCCKTGEKENNTDIKISSEDYETNKSAQILEMSETSSDSANMSKTKAGKCQSCCENMQHQFFAIKAVVIWVLIVITDGRYGGCFVKSVDELIKINHLNISSREPMLSWRELRSDYLIQVFQIIGLLVILLSILMLVFLESKVNSLLSSCGCDCDTESERIRKMNEDILLQITEDTIQEEARQRQKEFVVTLLSREDWGSYNPGQPNAQEELDKITAKWKEEVRKQLQGANTIIISKST